MTYRELVKPDAALFLRMAAIERFPAWDIGESIPEDEVVMLRDRPLLLIYSQDSFRDSEWSWTEVFGFRVFGGSRGNPTEARDAGALVAAWLWTVARHRVASPIAAVAEVSGPNLIDDAHETAVLYGTAEMTVAAVYAAAQSGL